jgi:hypothetical protein
MDCTDKELFNAVELLKTCFAVKADGTVFIRTVTETVTDCDAVTNAVNCDNSGTITLDTLIKQAITLDDCNKPALRLGVTNV